MPAVETKSAERQRFIHYLRTGRHLPATAFEPLTTPLEAKFNPYHDPRTGRFTFEGTGHYVSGRPGGFGGGGATGNWPRPDSHSSRSHRNIAKATRTGKPQTPPAAQPKAPLLIAPQQHAGQQNDYMLQRVVRNGYEYQIDQAKRTRRVSGTLTLNLDQPRSRSSQAGAGGSDRRPTDDGGHYIARRFNGPTEAFNHFAQDANFNRGGYRALENEWAKATREGKRVFVKITPHYEGSSQRPRTISARFTIDGKSHQVEFPNSPKGTSHAK